MVGRCRRRAALHAAPASDAGGPVHEGTPRDLRPAGERPAAGTSCRLAPVAVVHRAPWDRRRSRSSPSPPTRFQAPGAAFEVPACPGDLLSVLEGPPFDRYAVIPVARNVWQHVEGGSFAAAARRLIIARTTRRCSARPVSRRPAGSTLWKSVAFGSSRCRQGSAATPWTNREAPAARGGRPAGGSPGVRPRARRSCPTIPAARGHGDHGRSRHRVSPALPDRAILS